MKVIQVSIATVVFACGLSVTASLAQRGVGDPQGIARQHAKPKVVSLSGKVVEVKVMATDRYGRTVAMIYADKMLLNEELVKSGLAWVYWQYCHHPICESWKNLQIGARMDKRGLWADPDRIPPWEFRRKKRSR